MTHTPTPWRIENGTTLIWGKCDPDDTSDRGMGYPITECRISPISYSSWAMGPNESEGNANAAYIVHCVNSHSSLVEENKRMREALRGMVKACQIDGDWAGRHFIVAYDLWQAYLAAEDALGDTNA